MAIYTVHEPPLRGSAPDPERFVFVRDGFTFWAFLLAPVWMVWHRLWLVFLGYALLMVALQVALQWIGAPAAVAFAANFLVALLIGFEAASLRRFVLARRRWRDRSVPWSVTAGKLRSGDFSTSGSSGSTTTGRSGPGPRRHLHRRCRSCAGRRRGPM